MNVERIVKKYPILIDFLTNHFSQDMYKKYPYAENAQELLEEIVPDFYEDFIGTVVLDKLMEEMYFFIHTPILEEHKDNVLHPILEVELMGLKPIEFLRYLYYRFLIEKWKRS